MGGRDSSDSSFVSSKRMEDRLFALVDCNNFYVSCERLFRPDLWHRPVAVLSNNDGCIVARSQEVKALGIKMGTPVFKVQDLIDQHQITLFSSNYALYADLSARVMSTLEMFTPHLQVYSIDEAFLDLTGVSACVSDPVAYGQTIRQTVTQITGIPVCVGFGPTQTLAKLANFAAKKWPKTGGVVDLSDPQRRAKLMAIVPVEEVWGIGRKLTLRLNGLGIHTADQLAQIPIRDIRAQFNVTVAKTVMELNGVACLDWEETPAAKQQIVCSRSFGRKLTQLSELSSALAEFSSRAGEKLRRQKSVAGMVTVFIRTHFFNPQEPQYQRAASAQWVQPTQDTRVIIQTVNRLLADIYKPGYGYQKAGIQLSGIEPQNRPQQFTLFDPPEITGSALMPVLDQINRRYPKALRLARCDLKENWQPRSDRQSPHYTTRWADLRTVGCG